MHIEYRITEKDYRAAAMLAMRKRSTLSSIEYYGPYLFAILWVAVSLIPAYLHPDEDLDLVLTLGIVPIIMGFLVLRRKKIKAAFKKMKMFHLLQVLDLDTNGLRLVTTAGTSRSAWKVYDRFTEDDSLFILFLAGSEEIMPIPKGELTLMQIDELRSLLSARLPGGQTSKELIEPQVR
ncbi:MAG: YcxB family protein [Acidobacteriota bacterium]|nr:YcxB family protein [Acidobacteriota bacterium]